MTIRSAAYWGSIVGSAALAVLCRLISSYAKSIPQSDFNTPYIFALETEQTRAKVVSLWVKVLFVYLPGFLVLLMLAKQYSAKIWGTSKDKYIGNGWLDSRIESLKETTCNPYETLCFKLGGAEGDEYFPILTDLVPLVFFLSFAYYFVRWRLVSNS